MFTKSFFTAAAACALLASSVNAHMVITCPVPYGADSLTNSPLEPDGSDFPCKQRSGVYDMGIMNDIPVGVPQKLEFKGGATHGGGSCQLSVTLDKNPDKNSKWKVIHSILGGCPNANAGNANGSPNYQGNPTFEYTMPKGMPNGEYTMAWTWFNKIGNREMYMNCAPIRVTGGADNNDVLDTLPDMFVANIGNGCTTCENQDFVFPQCGLNVETVQKTALGSSTIGTCAAATGGSGSGFAGSAAVAPTAHVSSSPSAPAAQSYGPGSAASAPAQASGAAAAPTAPLYSSARAPAPTGYAGGSSVEGGKAAGGIVTAYDVVTETAMVTITVNGAAPRKPVASAAAPAGYGAKKAAVPAGYGVKKAPSSSSAAAPAGYGANKGVNPPSDSPSSNASAEDGASTSRPGPVPCTTPGEIICMEGSKFGICDNGFAVPMSLAQGTSCSSGSIRKRHNLARQHWHHLKPHGHKFQN